MEIVCLSSIDWDFTWQGRQQPMSTLVEQTLAEHQSGPALRYMAK